MAERGRFVFDTNVIVSALLIKTSAAPGRRESFLRSVLGLEIEKVVEATYGKCR